MDLVTNPDLIRLILKLHLPWDPSCVLKGSQVCNHWRMSLSDALYDDMWSTICARLYPVVFLIGIRESYRDFVYMFNQSTYTFSVQRGGTISRHNIQTYGFQIISFHDTGQRVYAFDSRTFAFVGKVHYQCEPVTKAYMVISSMYCSYTLKGIRTHKGLLFNYGAFTVKVDNNEMGTSIYFMSSDVIIRHKECIDNLVQTLMRGTPVEHV